eukprot:408564-Rhodomonas_salina.2
MQPWKPTGSGRWHVNAVNRGGAGAGKAMRWRGWNDREARRHPDRQGSLGRPSTATSQCPRRKGDVRAVEEADCEPELVLGRREVHHLHARDALQLADPIQLATHLLGHVGQTPIPKQRQAIAPVRFRAPVFVLAELSQQRTDCFGIVLRYLKQRVLLRRPLGDVLLAFLVSSTRPSARLEKAST